MHLDDEQLQRLLHQQVPPAARREARDHIAECAECRERLVSARRDEAEIDAMLRQLDHPIPNVRAEEVAARARGVGLAWGRWAAGFLLFLAAAGAAYAAPGSPLRQWVDSAVAWIAGSEQPAPPIAPERAKDTLGAGIAALPGRDFTIAFGSPEPGGEARVSLTEGSEVTVRALGGAAGFTSAAKRLVIDNARTGAVFEIEIPRTAPRVEIQVAGRRIFLKDGSRVVTDAAEEIGDRYTLSLDSAVR